MKKLLIGLLSLILVLGQASIVTKAQTTDVNEIKGIKTHEIRVISETKGPDYVEVKFIDPNKINSKDGISLYYVEEYLYSSYVHDGQALVASNVGPKEGIKCYESVARGGSVYFGQSLSYQGQLQIGVGVDAEIKKVIQLKVNGSYTNTWSKTEYYSETLTGPSDSSPYNSRDFYKATDYNRYTHYVQKYDWYRQVDPATGDVVGTRKVSRGRISINDVKEPKPARWSIDTNH